MDYQKLDKLADRIARAPSEEISKLWAEVTPELTSQELEKLLEMTTERERALVEAAQLIDSDDEVIYDVAADHGQQVANVKHMTWFQVAVAEWIQERLT